MKAVPPSKLRVIPEPPAGSRTVLALTNDAMGTVIATGMDYHLPDLLCGQCGVYIATSVNLKNIVLKCRCGAFNDTE
jgi:hypothetical protein